MRAPGENLPAEVIVYRALRSGKWRDKDTGAVLPVGFYVLPTAFYLREHPDHGPETGLSVSESRDGALSGLRKSYGLAQLVVGRVVSAVTPKAVWPLSEGESLGLLVIAAPTNRDPDHAEIRGRSEWVPATVGENAFADTVASVLARIANENLSPMH